MHHPEHPAGAEDHGEAPPPHGDHHRLGRELGIYTTSDALGAGLPLWLPAGATLRRTLEAYIVDLETSAGYDHVYSPPLAKRALYEQSGHWDHYRDAMFPPMRLGGDEIVLRPMNCPHHILIYDHAPRSHRELPVRIAECGQMFRNELSGAVGGLHRVRAMTLNDGHVFAAAHHVGDEVAHILSLIRTAHRHLGIDGARYRLSRRGTGNKYVDAPQVWAHAEAALERVLDAAGVDWYAAEGEAAFYGPKIDIEIRGHTGRSETLSTVQLDMVLPERFGLTYTGADGEQHRPVLIHRSIISTFERLVAHLLELHNGNLPLWLAPTQVAVLPVTDDHHSYASTVQAQLAANGLRVRLESGGPLGARVHRAREQRVPCTVVVGAAEAANGTVAVRARGQRQPQVMGLDELSGRLHADVAAHTIDGW